MPIHTPPVHNVFAAFEIKAVSAAVQVAEMELQYTATNGGKQVEYRHGTQTFKTVVSGRLACFLPGIMPTRCTAEIVQKE